MMMWVPNSAHRRSASFNDARRSRSRSSALRPPSWCGVTLNSMLNRASSVWYSALAIAASTSALSIRGL